LGNLYPVYVREKPILLDVRAAKPQQSFQKILDHRGIVFNEPIGALAHLQIGRAYSMQGNTLKAKAAYQDSSHSGKTPTRTFPSSSLQSLSTQSSNDEMSQLLPHFAEAGWHPFVGDQVLERRMDLYISQFRIEKYLGNYGVGSMLMVCLIRLA